MSDEDDTLLTSGDDEQSNSRLTPQQFQRAEDLFRRASRLPPEEVGSFLEAHCSDDARVRREVTLRLDQPTLEIGPVAQRTIRLRSEGIRSAPAFAEGRVIGPYRVGRQLGCGGMAGLHSGRQS